MSQKREFWICLLSVLCGASLFLFTPYKSTAAPQWSIQVVDQVGKPISGLHGAEEWSYFGIDLNPKIDFRNTDPQGQVVFPRRIIWASLASRLFNPSGASEKLGPSVWILACDDNNLVEGEVFWEGGRFDLDRRAARNVRMVAKPVKYCTMM